ncbi:MAG TPA: lectin [Actinocrinis sp.]|uniref:lectin n=1 Tax=Actinocrinis sp. TaxID=1920516 RepID=UPI002DDD7018|nr:lectin [Actinocrinis sp.]HEV3171016.1 lectin [Actinocrinis sp.]
MTAVFAAGASAAALACSFAAPAQAATAAALVTDPASLVNPFIGTTNSSDDFPGADSPLGMVQWSPDTPSRPDGGGYEYNDSSITGFSLTHLAGPGCGAAGDIPVLPTVGSVNTSATDSFSHANESANAGYYSVSLDNGVKTELTTTTRTGMARFTFPATTQANLIFKLNGSQNGDSNTQFNVLSNTEVSGQVTSGNFCSGGNSYTVYFDMRFSQSFANNGTAAVPLTAKPAATSGADKNAPETPNKPTLHGTPPKAKSKAGTATPNASANNGYVTFNTTGNQTVLAKVGLSYVSIANAQANLSAENPNWDFTGTQSAAHAAWNTLLGRAQIGGGTNAQQQEYYTALYHSLLHPNVISDSNGQYPGFDGSVHTADAGHSAAYGNYSGWDIYRSQAQLEALIDPQAASDTAQSMIDDYAQTGQFPKWSENSGETYVMVGDPADAIIADYYAFGARNFDTATALNDMIAEATNASKVRPGLNYLAAPGYMPHDGSYGCCNFYGPVSTTLEYNTADFALSAFAGALGNGGAQATFANRAQEWRNVLDPNSGFDAPRNANGTWLTAFDPTSGNDFVEADSFIYTGMVPFNLAGLAVAKGGNTAMNHYLDTVLRSFTGANGYAWVGNEPSIELPWEYDYTGAPYKTQSTVRAIQDQIWTDTPSGLADGNDDLGEMSSWFVWSALGMYPETPGTADLALGSPMFSQAVLTLPSGGTLTINGNGAADNAPYVQSATWNGGAWNNAYAPGGAISSGGTLTYNLSTSQNTSWASAANQAPPSYGGNTVAPASPRVGPITSGVSAGLCVDDSQSSTSDGSHVQIYGCDQTAAQDWVITTDGTLRTLGKCLDVSGGATTPGTLVQLYGCNNTGAQLWTQGANGSLVNPQSGLCLEDPNATTVNGTQLQINTCNNSAAQNWTLPPTPATRTGAITAGVGNNLCVDDNGALTADGTAIQIYTCNQTPAQTWTLAPDNTLQVLGSCMDAAQSGTTNGTLIQLYHCNHTGAQQWRATTSGQLINIHSGLCLDDPNATTTQRTQLQLYTCDNTPAQVWNLPS